MLLLVKNKRLVFYYDSIFKWGEFMSNQSSYLTHDTSDYQLIQHFDLPNHFPLDFIVLDFETTGLSPLLDEIIQIGALLYVNGKPIQTFEKNINPQRDIPDKISRLTGIMQSDVDQAPTISEVLPELLSFIKDYPIVAHHAPFDLNVLNINLQRNHFPPLSNLVIDTLQLARIYAPFTVKNYKLDTLKKEMKLNLDSHRAINDCYVTGTLYLECKAIIDIL